MFRPIRRQQAVSSIEYIALITFIVTAILVFQRYIYRGMAGSWKSAGDTFGHGRQYDPRPFGRDGEDEGTQECFFDYIHCKPDIKPPCSREDRINTWLDKRCVKAKQCDCTVFQEDWDEYNTKCLRCYADCRSDMCLSNMQW